MPQTHTAFNTTPLTQMSVFEACSNLYLIIINKRNNYFYIVTAVFENFLKLFCDTHGLRIKRPVGPVPIYDIFVSGSSSPIRESCLPRRRNHLKSAARVANIRTAPMMAIERIIAFLDSPSDL